MFNKIFAIASNTFLETIRQPIYGIILILTCFMMILNNSLAAYTLSDDNLFLRDLGLSTLLVSGLFLAAFSAAGVLNREIENKTVLTIISKPVNRPTLILGKFAGLITALTTAFYISTLAFILVVRHKVLQNATDPWDWPVLTFGFGTIFIALLVAALGNYWYGWQFSSAAVALVVPLLTLGFMMVTIFSPKWELQFPQVVAGQLLAAILEVLLMVWLIAAIALAVSCRMGQVGTLTFCVILVMIGLTSDYFFGQHHLADKGLFEQPHIGAQFAWLAYRIVPNLGVFWVSDAMTAGKFVTISYLLSSFGYAMLYILATLLIGISVFQRREVG